MIRDFEWAPVAHTLARFSFESDGILLRGIAIQKTSGGGLRIRPPKIRGEAAFVVPPETWDEIYRAAVERYGRHLRSAAPRDAVIGRTDHPDAVAIDLA